MNITLESSTTIPKSYLYEVTLAPFPGHMTLYYILLPFRLAFILISLVGNGMTLRVILASNFIRIPANRIIVSLACADILVATEQVSLICQYHFQLSCANLLISDVLCVLCLLPYAVSFCHIFLVCLDRFVSIQWSLQYLSIMTDQRNCNMIIGTWALAFIYILTFLPYFILGDGYPNCLSAIPKEHDYLLKYGLFFLLSPITIAMYFKIFVVARRHRKVIALAPQAPASEQDPQQAAQKSREMRATSMMAVVILMYFVLWMPYFTTCTFIFLSRKSIALYAVHQVTRFTGTCNSGVNFFIYAYMNRGFRAGYGKILGCAKWAEGGANTTMMMSARVMPSAANLTEIPNRMDQQRHNHTQRE